MSCASARRREVLHRLCRTCAETACGRMLAGCGCAREARCPLHGPTAASRRVLPRRQPLRRGPRLLLPPTRCVPRHPTLPQAAAKRLGVELRNYSIIYDLIDDVRAAMEGRLKSGARPRLQQVPAAAASARSCSKCFCSAQAIPSYGFRKQTPPPAAVLLPAYTLRIFLQPCSETPRPPC
jgi:hypothetical protein